MSEQIFYNSDEWHSIRDSSLENNAELAPHDEMIEEQQKYDEIQIQQILDLYNSVHSRFTEGAIDKEKKDELITQVLEIARRLPAPRLKVIELAEKLQIPEDQIDLFTIEVGGKSWRKLKDELQQKNLHFDYELVTRVMMSDAFEKATKIPITKQSFISLSLNDLGFSEGATLSQIIGTENDTDESGNVAPYTGGKMTALGLELCSPDTGPRLRLQTDSPDWLFIAMKPTVRRIFFLNHNSANSLVLGVEITDLDDYWPQSTAFVFRLRI